MKKSSIRILVVLGVILAEFLVISFAIPFTKNSVFWIAFVFGFIAIALQLYVVMISSKGDDTAKSRFYGFPIIRIGGIYLIVQFCLSILEMALSELMPKWIPAIVNVILLAVAVIGCIAAEAARDEIVKQDNKVQKQIKTIRGLQTMSASIVGLTDNGTLRSELQNVADEFRYSDPVSSEATEAIEAELKAELDELQRTVLDGNSQAAQQLSRMIILKLNERNRICKANK